MRLPFASTAFLAMAGATGVNAFHAFAAFLTHGGMHLGLLALYAAMRTVVGVMFVLFTVKRSEPYRRSREPVAFLACAVAMLAVVLGTTPSRHTPSSLLLSGDAVAVAGTVWILASVAALGRCFGVLPEARGLVTRGPYRFMRHPVYLGEIVALSGLTLASPTTSHLALLGVFVLAQSMRMSLEEKALSEAFPAYSAYAERTPRLLLPPRVAVGVAVAAVVALAVAVLPAQAGLGRDRAALAAKRRHRPNTGTALRAPSSQSPANGANVQSLPAFQWSAVAHAASYQFQLSADPRFGSIVETSFAHRGSLATYNTAVAIDKAVPNGVYYWRVRALTAKGAAGPWSASRRLVKAWTAAPQLLGPNVATVSWPAQPLVFSWSTVPYAVKYLLTVATDPGLANQVIGTAAKPLETQGTVFTPSVPLTTGTYFWAVIPLDASGHKGTRSQVATFAYSWPTATATSLTDLNPDARVFDPLFSWAPVPGAARYEVEINAAEDFPTGSKWCCAGTTIGTSLAPQQVLANNAYYWRVRAIDSRGNAGVWNYGQPFTKAFDNVTPTIPNLKMIDTHGNALSEEVPATHAPIVTWDPVPGASRYEVQAAPYGMTGCDWSQVALDPYVYQTETATTAWTPLGNSIGSKNHIGPSAWPVAQHTFPALPAGGAQYCLRVLARSDDDAQHGQVVSDWTQINGADKPAFVFLEPETVSGPGVATPESAYIGPKSGTINSRTPLFTWTPVAGAKGYYVVISRDANFTQIADVGYTNIPAYAPRLANSAPLSDETTAYYWAAIPSANADGSGVSHDVPQENAPQWFNKSSVPPNAIAPVNGTVVSTQPTFRWTAVENARNYRLQVATDLSFGNPLEDVTTDATAFTSSSTYPPNTVLYWRVRANDWIGQGLNWSAIQTFQRTLPAPVPSPGNASGGEPIPVLNWAPVQGAVGYEIHVDKVDGKTQEFSFPAAAFTPTAWYGVGVWRWEVRADFPTALGRTVPSGYSMPVQFVRTLNPPTGAYGVKTKTRVTIAWNPDPAAKEYEVEIATNDGFSTTLESHRTQNTNWAPNVKLTTPQARGRLYWRVAAIDGMGNIGSFVSGSFGKAPPAKVACRRTVRKAKGRKVVVVKRCATSRPKRKERHH